MIMLKSTHEREVTNFTELLSLTNKELVAAKKQAEKLEDTNKAVKELRKIIKALEKDKLELDFCNQEAKKEIKRLNTRVNVNAIARNQLRDLCVYKDNQGRAVKTKNDVLVHEKIDGKKVWDLAMLIG